MSNVPFPATRRAALMLTGAAALSTGTATWAKPAQANTMMFEHTFLKAKPGRRDALARYIELNWFVMDQRGLEAGIFTSYELLAAIDENKDWDLVMVVGYPQGEGFSDPKTRDSFLAIRRAHVEVRVEEMGLKDLGDIVQHHRLRSQARGG
jgi:hypothetical protein